MLIGLNKIAQISFMVLQDPATTEKAWRKWVTRSRSSGVCGSALCTDTSVEDYTCVGACAYQVGTWCLGFKAPY